MKTKEDKIIKWLLGDDTGLSSRHMAAIACELEGNGNHPHDAGDFGRCKRLVDAVPEVRGYFERIADTSPAWRRIIDNWDELCELCYVPGGVWEKFKELNI